MANSQFVCRIFFPQKKSARSSSPSLSEMLCLSAPIDFGKTELPLGLVSLRFSLNSIPVISGQLLLGMCAVSCLKLLCLSWSGLCMYLQSSVANPEIPELKMPIWLLFVIVFSSALPQWATSKLSNNAANWAGFDDFKSPPAYQIGRLKKDDGTSTNTLKAITWSQVGLSPLLVFHFNFWLNSCTLGRGQDEITRKQKSPVRCTPHWKIFYISASDAANSEQERRGGRNGTRMVEFSLAGEEKTHCLQPHNHLAWCVMFIKNRGSHMAGCQQDTASLN